MKSLVLRTFFLLVFIVSLIALIALSRGYRLNFSNKSIESTGILVASSYPTGAKIYVNGVLKDATNANIILNPGQYNIEIKKEGYSVWKKQLNIKGEVVTKADALLFPQNPSLAPVTSLGINKAKFVNNFDKTILISINSDEEKDGIYLLDNKENTLSLFSSLKLIALKKIFPQNIDILNSDIKISPDGKQIILSIKEEENIIYSYLLNTNEENKNLFNITGSEENIIDAWNKKEIKNTEKILETFKSPIQKIATDSMKIISFSPDESKFFYKATKNTELPLVIIPQLIGTNQTEETRQIIKDYYYVYDKKEDKNFLINKNEENFENNVIWYPESKHLIIKEDKIVNIVEYDGSSKQTVYSGPFEQDFLAVTNEGRLIILANLNPQNNKLPDVYTVGIK